MITKNRLPGRKIDITRMILTVYDRIILNFLSSLRLKKTNTGKSKNKCTVDTGRCHFK